ncbi:carbon-monoxide dehydrogenase catalytic subunit [Rhodospirillum rubrum]|uniref:anaerobic carbon-monoxide dehydrogenase catalytic subunit n=1 Tax=Rhodospirillum rubrum TaxID=1085 RepID=UPI001904BA2A|nr:anaerobic carbon-monoxide dehydrogenase catalytic subunit [Rhodospirillum rubrum]MBK1662902.1 carbon-monoxide dehydrogenase catalytic subunit [Rhodospirillum rubrum]MBK1677088.1 carbon-monoxide dehydrogenase catalytic subunit [Rhodospirillum rubrum]
MTHHDCAHCSSDACATEMLSLAEANSIETAWHRHEKQQPQCGFGSAGLCCRICLKGPCRIDPFGEGPKYGVCGADRDTIVARHLVRMIAAGTAAHSEHGRHIALAMQHISQGELHDYSIRDEAKLYAIAKTLGVATEGRGLLAIVGDLAAITLGDFQNQDYDKPCAWLAASLTPRRVKRLGDLGLLPHNIDASVAQTMSRTHVGCDADPTNLILGGLRVAMADLDGSMLATELSDALFGTPQPVVSAANLGVMKRGAVNIAVNGHNPMLSDIICDVAADLRDEAIAAGAAEGINIIGICCTGHEVMMRHGVPLATNYLSQELPILTGALEAMVVDVQCIMPSLPRIAECFHTQIITTDKHNKISGATHVPFDEHKAVETAKTIIRMAIAAFGRRDPNRVAIPNFKQKSIVGFSAEAIVAALAKVNADDPLKPLVDNVVNGNIQGIVLFVGCNTTKVQQDSAYVDLAKSLAKRNVLVLATGCAAGAFAKAGLMTSEATTQYAGEGLKGVLSAIGTAAGLGGPLPLVMHMGSCVDNSRAVALATALANKLGVDLSDLPLVASAPECMSEKALAIGSWAVTIGLPTHVGSVPPVIGSQIVTKLVTETAKELVGGYFIVDTDPKSAGDKLYAAIQERRAGLGL